MKKVSLFISIILLALVGNAQDVRFAQAYSNPLRLNPAIMGANTDLRVILNYRDQWKTIDKGYTSYAFSALYPLYIKDNKNKLDIGLNTFSDKVGAFNATDFALSLGYSVKMANTSQLSFALLGGYFQKSIGLSNLSFDEQYVAGSYNSFNPISEIIPNTKSSGADLGFGLMWYYNPDTSNSKINAFMGVSGYHLNTPNESFVNGGSSLPGKLSFQGGIKILGNKVDVTPNVRVTTQQGAEEIAAGISMDYKANDKMKIVAGAWYRTHDAFAIALGLEHKSFTFGYSYDIITGLNQYVSPVAANEISISYKLNFAEKKGIAFNPSPMPLF
jgi:type IX secretion system PorP/SprF family membrane protein